MHYSPGACGGWGVEPFLMFFWLDWVSFWDEKTTNNDNSDLLFLLPRSTAVVSLPILVTLVHKSFIEDWIFDVFEFLLCERQILPTSD